MGIFDAIAGLAGDIIGAHSANKAQKRANKTNIALQRENQTWEERMSSTSYQRGTQDMLAAGLNPMLAYSQGGASTPNSAAATVHPVDAGAKAISSATGNFLARRQAEATIDLTQAQADKARSEAHVSAASVDSDINQRAMANDMLKAQVQQAWANRDLTIEQRNQLQQMLPYLQAQTDSLIALQEQQANSASAGAKLSDSQTGLNHVRKIAETLGLSQAEADSAFYETVKAGAKGAPFATNILKLLIELFGKDRK